MTTTQAPPVRHERVSTWTVSALLVGLPAAYWLSGALFPWGGQLFGDRNHDAFHGFWLSVMVLHWLSVLVCVVIVRRHGIQLSELGLPDRSRALRMAAVFVGVGLALVLVRALLGPLTIFGGTPFFGSGAPVGVTQRLVWIAVAITAGVCEEFVYRGALLTLLRRRGIGTGLAVALATVSFALMHGPAGIFGFPFVGSLALAMSILYLRTRRLAPGMAAHALLDLSVILT